MVPPTGFRPVVAGQVEYFTVPNARGSAGCV